MNNFSPTYDNMVGLETGIDYFVNGQIMFFIVRRCVLTSASTFCLIGFMENGHGSDERNPIPLG
ncbi:hypothetical protein HMPREF1144_0329 [Klebsiella sp. OBRC7]|nr:hypothetical protein HMPREF1144_0329 [Klebsiella sp. OBRC7]